MISRWSKTAGQADGCTANPNPRFLALRIVSQQYYLFPDAYC